VALTIASCAGLFSAAEVINLLVVRVCMCVRDTPNRSYDFNRSLLLFPSSLPVPTNDNVNVGKFSENQEFPSEINRISSAQSSRTCFSMMKCIVLLVEKKQHPK